MEDKIQEYLENIYNFKIKVEFKDFRQYEIKGKIDPDLNFNLVVLYDVTLTLEANIILMVRKIDNEIIQLFKKAYN